MQQAHANGSLASTLSEFAAEIRNAQQSPEAQILISIDQGEELFTNGDPDQVRFCFAILLRELFDRFGDDRLLSVEQWDQKRWVEVAHQALLRKWPLLGGWLDETREYLVGSQQLETELAQWQQAPDTDKETALVSGLKLSHARAWLEDRPQQFGSDLQAFVRASMAHRDRAATQRRRQRRLVLAGLAGLSAAATAAWGWAQWSSLRAYEAQTRQFQSIHLSMLDLDPVQSVVHGLAAMARLHHNPSEALPLTVCGESWHSTMTPGGSPVIKAACNAGAMARGCVTTLAA